MKTTKLKQIAQWCGGTLHETDGEVEVRGVSTDSREVKPGQMFIPLVGARVDGHTFISRAVENGAVAVLNANKEKQPKNVPILRWRTRCWPSVPLPPDTARP